MPIDYSNDWAKSLSNALSTVGQVNKASPTPNYNGINGVATMDTMTPEQINGQFDTSYQSATAGFAPFPGDKSKINQLQDLYGTVGDAYDVTDTLAALGATRKSNLLVGEQAANTTARKYMESGPPSSSSSVGAAAIRAQSLLPFLNADTEAAGAERKYADNAKQQALSTASDIATKLAQLTQNYTDSLAAYNSQKANFGLNYATSRTGQALKASSNQISSGQLAEQARQANLQAALQARGQDLSASQTATNQQLEAQSLLLKNLQAPTGQWTTDNNGRIVSGQADYDAYQQYLARKSGALGSLTSLT